MSSMSKTIWAAPLLVALVMLSLSCSQEKDFAETETVPVQWDYSKDFLMAEFPAITEPSGFRRPAYTFKLPSRMVPAGHTFARGGRITRLRLEFDLRLPVGNAQADGAFGPNRRFSGELVGRRADLANKRILEKSEEDARNGTAETRLEFIEDGDLYGLKRYSRVNCWERGRFEGSAPVPADDYHTARIRREYAAAQAARAADDSLKDPYCFAERSTIRLVMGPDASLQEQVHIDCMLGSCTAHVNISEAWAVGVNLGLRDLPNWREISGETRRLFRSFVVKPQLVTPESQ